MLRLMARQQYLVGQCLAGQVQTMLGDIELNSGKELRVLVVDDDDLVLNSLVLLLSDLGHIVVTATSGEEALDLLPGDPKIDLVITDYAMPTMNGSELADLAWERYPGLPIFLATGYTKLPFGANPALQLISKPVSQERLSEIIAALKM